MGAEKSITLDKKWRFWIDRGGTFTDIVALAPTGSLVTKKLLSENPEAYPDAALQGIRDFLDVNKEDSIPGHRIAGVKMGTTVATNALLERDGEPTVFVATKGLSDILEIGHQARPDIFALNILKPSQLYSSTIEINERIQNDGTVICRPDAAEIHSALQAEHAKGIRSVAIALMHAYRNPEHELLVANIAMEIGFTQISMSHEVSPLAGLVSRGNTTVVDAYLTPILRNYIDRISTALHTNQKNGPQLLFMQSSGGLTKSDHFKGRNSVLSGPAGGVVGAVKTSVKAGFEKIVGFDMGGTSTDVCHYAGEYERSFESEVDGISMRAPMMDIHTVAAGGGSILSFDGERFRVGPESAGANPGPKCYRRDGPLAVTDINVTLGKLQPDYFPSIFGPGQDQPLDRNAAAVAFQKIADQLEGDKSLEEVAEGFLTIAIEHMAQAIKKISIERGYDIEDYALTCFGGAGGQHACLVAERLGMSKVLIHPFAGVLSAFGIGLADLSDQKQETIEQKVFDAASNKHKQAVASAAMKDAKGLAGELEESLALQGVALNQLNTVMTARLRFDGSDTSLVVPLGDSVQMCEAFKTLHHTQFSFVDDDKDIIIESINVEVFGGGEKSDANLGPDATLKSATPDRFVQMYSKGGWHNTAIYKREQLAAQQKIAGPAIIVEENGTNIVEPGWSATMTKLGDLILLKEQAGSNTLAISGAQKDPVTLELFNNLFMSAAEQMGVVLKNTASSVNIKERLDFSCAIFDAQGGLVANAPHVPVHLGSMDASVRALINSPLDCNPGDAFVHNNPYDGGTHLPDINVITPVFDETDEKVSFYVASRGHHADIGGIAPGSMSPDAASIDEEGVIIDCQKLVRGGEFLEESIRDTLSSAKFPARNIDKNIADLKAQIAANAKGASELKGLQKAYGIETVAAYMQFIQENAEASIKRVISKLQNCSFRYEMDQGCFIEVAISVDEEAGTATVDFTGTSPQQPNNFNAPYAVAQAAVLYVFRCLIDDDIPLNAGCLRPLNIIIPEGTIISPAYPAAVVAGNVEVSQAVTNALFGALGVLGSSQGSMNNLTFGDKDHQYYETICSGAPAGPGFDGVAGVHTHMTNSRLTDPEILELRYPVMLEEFRIVRGSGGEGKHKGGDGVTRTIRFNAELDCAILSSNREVPPFGTKGGEPGRIGQNILTRANGEKIDLGGCAHVTVFDGDQITVITPTAGGYSTPEE